MTKEIYDVKNPKSFYNMDVTVKLALENFQKANLEEMIENCGFTPEEGGFGLRFINLDLKVEYPSGEVIDKSTGKPVNDTVKVLVLHHAVYAKGGELGEGSISYKELPGGEIYIDPFTRRCLNALTGIFGSNIEALKKAVAATDHIEENFGDYSCTIRVMPKIPITLIVYEADDEFPASSNALFNKEAANFLHTEDYNQITSYLVSTLKKIAFA
ncbi:MAG: DUF3786 domain-containing protein [Bacillota bacterium]|nr:DUF3786 domain-containing protein [Bacillota bacterium]